MKKIGIILSLLGVTFVKGQQIKDTMSIKLSTFGDQHQYLIHWGFTDGKEGIYVRDFNHLNGAQFVATAQEMKELEASHEKKTLLGKIVSNIVNDNLYYRETLLPIIRKTEINFSQKKISRQFSRAYHRVENLPKEHYVYFKRSNRIPTISQLDDFEDGSVIDYHYSDAYLFSGIPALNTKYYNFPQIDFEGEGFLGLKNISPILKEKFGLFYYDPSRGFISDLKEKKLCNTLDIIKLEKPLYVRESAVLVGKNLLAWFQDDKNPEQFQQLYYDYQRNAPKINTYAFDNERTLRHSNIKVYDASLKETGVISVFGYAKGNKKKKQYAENNFDIIYTDVQGNEINRWNVDFGEKKEYKRSITPLFILKNSENELLFINSHHSSLFAATYEIFRLDIPTGKITIDSNTDFFREVSGEEGNVYPYFQKRVANFKVGDNLVFVGKIEEDSGKKGAMNQMIKYNVGFNLIMLGRDYQPICKLAFTDVLPKNYNSPIFFDIIEETTRETTVLVRQGTSFYMIKFYAEGKMNIERIKTPYDLPSTDIPFTKVDTKNFLVDEDKRVIYLLHQFMSEQSFKRIEQIGITTISY